MRKYLIIVLMFMVYMNGYAGKNTYSCYINNVKQTADNQLQFDIWLKGDADFANKLNGVQAGIDFDFNAITNGGMLTFNYVPNSADNILNTKIDQNGIMLDSKSNQLRVIAFMNNLNRNIKVSTSGLRLGTFTITNTVAFTEGSSPMLQWSFEKGSKHSTFSAIIFKDENLNATKQIDHANYFVKGGDIILQKGKGMIDVATASQAINIYVVPARKPPYKKTKCIKQSAF